MTRGAGTARQRLLGLQLLGAQYLPARCRRGFMAACGRADNYLKAIEDRRRAREVGTAGAAAEVLGSVPLMAWAAVAGLLAAAAVRAAWRRSR